MAHPQPCHSRQPRGAVHSPKAAVLLQSFWQLGGWKSSRAGESVWGKTFTSSCVWKSQFCFLEEAGDPIPTPSATMSIPVLCTHVLCVWSFTSRSGCLCSKCVISRKQNCWCTDSPVLSGHIRRAAKSPASSAEHGLQV